MRMAAICGLDVAPVALTTANGKDVLLVERFDRLPHTRQRRAMVSALTILGIPEIAPREASYARLAEIMRERFNDPQHALPELFGRIIFNVLAGNTDDHARNHAAFWDGKLLTLTPAYDVCTYVRGGGEATQAMLIGLPDDPYRYSNVAGCVARAGLYGLSTNEATDIVERQLATIDENWDRVCDEAELAQDARRRSAEVSAPVRPRRLHRAHLNPRIRSGRKITARHVSTHCVPATLLDDGCTPSPGFGMRLVALTLRRVRGTWPDRRVGPNSPS